MEIISQKQLPVRQLKEAVQGIVDGSLPDELSELEDKLASSRFYLVVLGMFKRGKSTLINGLLGKEIAPVGVIPLTAIITLFEYAADQGAEVVFADGIRKRIATTAINLYVTEENNPENKKEVRYVKIFDNVPLLRQMHLVDTPGLGSEFDHNTHTTLSFIPKVDAALFVVSADTPISKADLTLLKELQQSVPKVLYVLNKADLLSPGELEKMEAYNQKAVTAAMQENDHRSGNMHEPEWFTVSSKPESPHYYGIERLRERLFSLSDKEKRHMMQQASRNHFKTLFSEAKMQVSLQLDTLQMPLHELEEKQKRFHESLGLLQEQRNEFASVMKGRIAQLQQAIDREVKECEKMLKGQLQTQLIGHGEKAYEQMMQEGIEAFQDSLVNSIIQRFDGTKQLLEEKTRMQFRELLEQYCSRSQSFLNELATHLQSLLGIDYHQIGALFDLSAYTAFYFDKGRGEKTVYLRPSFILRKTGLPFLKKKLMKRIYLHNHQLIITNTSGIIYDLQYKIQESFRKFSYDLDHRLSKLLLSIEKVISDTIKARTLQSRNIEKQAQKLSDALRKLEELENDNW